MTAKASGTTNSPKLGISLLFSHVQKGASKNAKTQTGVRASEFHLLGRHEVHEG